MANKSLVEQYYQILNINPECSWEELRRAYKKQIQKWHPDRFASNSSDKEAEAAGDKIKNINNAFNYFLKYYNDNGYLPPIRNNELDISRKENVHVAENKATRPSENKHSPHQTRIKTKENRSFSFYLIITATTALIYLLATLEDKESQLPYRDPTIHIESRNQGSDENKINTPSTNSEEHAGKAISEDSSSDDRYFTFGSSIGDVIAAQGQPTKIDGDTWYYGKATVSFKDGVVVGWKRDSDTPLKINIDIN